MFSYCSGLTSLNINGLDTSKVTDMYCMFSNCSGLTSLDLSGLNTSQVTNMCFMFLQCSGLTSLNLSDFDTSNTTDMRGMFSSCSGLTSLDLSSFETGNLWGSYAYKMFEACSSLTKIIAPENKSSVIMDLPTEECTWKYQPTGEIVTKITNAGIYIRVDEENTNESNNDGTNAGNDTEVTKTLEPIGTILYSTNLTGTGIPANSSFTVTSSDPKNPTVAFNGVNDENAAAVTIPSTITYNGVTYKVTSVAVTDFSKTKENAQFKVTGNQVGDLTVEYTAPANKKKTSVTIPEYTTYKGIKFKVTSVAAKAFKNNKKVKKVTVPASIAKIGKESFRNCKNLKKITIKSKNLKSIGKNAFKGINKKCKIKVPKSKLKAYKKLFKKKGQAKTVKITK